MTDETIPSAEAMREPNWTEKVLALQFELSQANIPHAFGGAIALNYHREPRATLNIDVNIFLSPSNESQTLDVLRNMYGMPDEEQVKLSLSANGQARSLWGHTYIDLFFKHRISRIYGKPGSSRAFRVRNYTSIIN